MYSPYRKARQNDFLGPRNMLGVVTDVSEGSYTIGTRDGTASTNYTRNQFDVCSSNIFLQPSSVTAVTITQTSAMRNAFLGIDTSSCCRCSHCKTNRCPCRKSGRSCGSKCHMGAKCFTAELYNVMQFCSASFGFQFIYYLCLSMFDNYKKNELYVKYTV